MADDITSRAISPSHKPIMLVGEYWTEQDELEGKPFAATHGGLMRGLFRQAGLDYNSTYVTCVFNQRPRGNRLEAFCGPKESAMPGYRSLAPGKHIHSRLAGELKRLEAEIERVQPNVILAAGNLALWALCKKSGIKKYRGSPLLTHDGNYKVIPIWGPSSIFRQWELRIITLADLGKAATEARFPELRRPTRYIYLEPTLKDIESVWREYLEPSPFLSCDIETKGTQITEVGYASADGHHALVIPFYSRLASDGNYWDTLKEEREAWNWVRRINREKPLIGQNFQYDMAYFWKTVGIPCPQFLGDTMLLHHSLQPELEKGLGFLGSIYTNEPSWKFMRHEHDTIKKED